MAPDTRPMRDRMAEYVLDLQDRIVTALEGVDPSAPKFKRDRWTRSQGGYGISCVFPPAPSPPDAPEPTTVLEKGGVNISVLHGALPAAAVMQMKTDHATINMAFDPNDPEVKTKKYPFFATGLSLVIHPRNPNAPTVHCNYRYFELSEPESSSNPASVAESISDAPSTISGVPVDKKAIAWWFGGGADLTPSYLFPEDAVHFHRTLKDACDPHGSALFPTFKKWCDEYFFITHRGEARGLGGIFFDDLSDAPHKRLADLGVESENARPTTQEGIFEFVKSCGDAFVPSYVPILSRRKDLPSNAHMRRWQLIRRGRYVEFNLVIDRGTKFGLMTPGARIESILMSLPETARWEYMSEMGTQEDTEEHKLMQVLKNPRDWV